MTLILTPTTQKLLEEQMAKSRCSDPDELVRLALQTFDQSRSADFDDLDPETQAALEEAEQQFSRGEGEDWAVVRQQLKCRFIDKT